MGRRLARFQRRKRFCRRHRSARYSWHLKPRCVLHFRTSPWPSKGRRMRRFPLQQHRYLDHWCQHPLGDMSPCFDIIPAANLLCSLCRVFANIFPSRVLILHLLVDSCLKQMGWFGFNAGSALSSGSDAVHALFNTHIAACSSTVTFVVVHKMIYKKHISVLAMLNGAVRTPARALFFPRS